MLQVVLAYIVTSSKTDLEKKTNLVPMQDQSGPDDYSQGIFCEIRISAPEMAPVPMEIR